MHLSAAHDETPTGGDGVRPEKDSGDARAKVEVGDLAGGLEVGAKLDRGVETYIGGKVIDGQDVRRCAQPIAAGANINGVGIVDEIGGDVGLAEEENAARSVSDEAVHYRTPGQGWDRRRHPSSLFDIHHAFVGDHRADKGADAWAVLENRGAWGIRKRVEVNQQIGSGAGVEEEGSFVDEIVHAAALNGSAIPLVCSLDEQVGG